MGCSRVQLFPFAVSEKVIFIGDFGLYLFLVFIVIPSSFFFLLSLFYKKKRKRKKPRMLYIHYSC